MPNTKIPLNLRKKTQVRTQINYKYFVAVIGYADGSGEDWEEVYSIDAVNQFRQNDKETIIEIFESVIDNFNRTRPKGAGQKKRKLKGVFKVFEAEQYEKV